ERGVARADDRDLPGLELVRIDQPGREVRQVLARRAEPPRVALRADREDDRLGHQVFERGLQDEVVVPPFEAEQLAAIADFQTQLRHRPLPGVEDRLARAGREGQVAPQRHEPRLGHDVLALLVAVDRVGEVLRPLEHHVGKPGRLRASRRGQPCGPRAHDHQVERIAGHEPPCTPARFDLALEVGCWRPLCRRPGRRVNPAPREFVRTANNLASFRTLLAPWQAHAIASGRAPLVLKYPSYVPNRPSARSRLRSADQPVQIQPESRLADRLDTASLAEPRPAPARKASLMCLAIPGQVVEVVDAKNRLAKVDVAGVQRTVNIALLDSDGQGVRAGDWVLIHVGFAMSKVDETEARATLALLEQLGSEYEQELHELRASAIE